MVVRGYILTVKDSFAVFVLVLVDVSDGVIANIDN